MTFGGCIVGLSSAALRAQPRSSRRYLMRLGRSTYVIHYVEDEKDQVIVRIWHGREDRPA